MQNSFLPVALGLLAVVAVPLKTHAAEEQLVSNADVPVHSEDETGAVVVAQQSPESTATMPIAQESNYTESSGALNFEPKPFNSKSVAIAAQPTQESAQASAAEKPADENGRQDIFEGGSESLVARTVGAAEGTRMVNGDKTQNYHGHVDPGNGVWNRGTFSYQFGNSENLTPDEADRRQLAKIKRIYESVMLPKAQKHGVAPLTLAEEINGIDLINQAPLAVTEDGGYIERLAEAKSKGLTGEDAILKARIWAFWDADKGGWDAPGLRAYDDMGKEESIRRDQDRRMAMIGKALEIYKQQNGDVANQQTDAQKTASQAAQGQVVSSRAIANSIANDIIFGGKPATRG